MYKKFTLILLLLSALHFQSQSQNITNYSFASNGGTFTALSGATTPSAAGSTDDGYWNGIPIGFNYWYMGVRYTTVSASTNGWLTFGADITDPLYTNNLSGGGAPRPVVAPLWDDLDIQSFANASYVTTGTAGSRVFTIQFLNAAWNYRASGNTISYQVKLFEGTGKIEFQYRQESGSLRSASANIGITATATGAGNFLSVNNAGTSISSTSVASVTSKPTTGIIYSFTPPVPTAPGSLTFTGVTNNSMTLNWVDFSSNETGFLIYRSTDGVNYSFVTQTAANTTTSFQTGLTTGALYYWRVFAVSEGALSTTAATGSSTAVCAAPPAPTVTSPVAYCQNAIATQLTATGTNLLWGGGAGSAGGATALTTITWIDNAFSNKKTYFTTLNADVTITSVDYYVPAWQTVNGLTLSLYNSSGTIIATSSTNTTLTSGAVATKITNSFNYTLISAGDYSIGVSSGSGSIGTDNPAFPISEVTGTIDVTGVSSAGNRCFNNIQFTNGTNATAPVPSTLNAGTKNYLVSQTVAGCTSPLSTIVVNVTGDVISQIPTSNLIAHYKFNGNANDASGNNAGTLQNGPTSTADRFGIINKAYNFNGSSQYVSTANAYPAPGDFTVSIWFKTNTTTGGKLIGFGSSQTGTSGQYDRHIYMNNAGQIYFGVYPNTVVTVNSALAYNDDKWHLATATLSAAGMALYIDGAQVGSNNATTTGQNYPGYWRIAFDNCNGWTSSPASYYFKGSLDDALIYSRALSAAEVATLYKSPDGAGNNGPVCSGATLTLNATTFSGASYSWTGPNSFSFSAQNPSFNYTASNAGTYTLQATVNSCVFTAYTNVISTSVEGQWTGNISADWADANNWCAGVVPGATTNVTISASAVRMPVITSTANCNNLVVNSGATVTTNAAGTLNVAGNIANNGTMTNNGTINFNGTGTQQTFAGITNFNNLTLSNTNGLLLPGAITIGGNLTLTSGILNTNNFPILIAGNWINNNSVTAFASGTSTVTFNGSANQYISGSAVTTFNHVTVNNNGYVLSLAVNTNISGNLTVSTGTFDLGAFTANRVTAGGTLVVDNNATLKIGGNKTYPSNFTTNNLSVSGTVEYSGTNQTVSSKAYGNLKLSSSSGSVIKTLTPAISVLGNLISVQGAGTAVTFTAVAAITVSGNVSIGTATTFNGGNYNHSVGGDWTNAGIFNGNTGTITFTGSGKLVSGTGVQNFNNLTVAASGVSFSNESINLSGNLATTGSGTFSQASGGTLTMTGASKTISGTGISLDNLSISGTVSTAASFDLTGNLNVSGSFTSSAGTFSMSGTGKTITGSGTKNFFVFSSTGSIMSSADFSISSGLVVSGSLTATSGTAIFTGNSVLSGTANLFNVNINGTSLQLSANSNLGVANALTVTSGTLNTTSSLPNTVNFNGSAAQNINAITYDNLNLSNGGNKTAISAITVNRNITIGTGVNFVGGSYTHTIYQNWVNNGNYTAGTSTIQFLGNQTSNITGATTFNILTVNSTSSSNGLVLQSNINAATVNMTLGNMLTGNNTISISNTRTGNGIILGNINRTHAFSTGVAYAFEGPENTITFSAVSAVTSITVSVKPGSIADFPFGGSIAREYNISVPAGSYNATLRLHYEDNELNGSVESSMALWNYNGSAWTAIGKTGNNTTSNYVEQSGLTNISNRWTCSDNSNVVQWNGSVSNDWNTAANWTVTQGSGSRPPAASDIVNIGTATFINNPTISNAVSVKNINFGSAQAVTLTMATGGSLVTGDLKGSWSTSRTHTINANNQAITINGDLALSDGATGHKINLNIGTGTITVAGNLNQSGTASIVFSGAGNLSIGKNFNYVDGTFTAGAGSVTYNGLVNQIAGAVNYNNLKVNKTAALASINSTLTINGNLDVIAGELDNYASTTIVGDVTIFVGATLKNESILHVGGNWINNGIYTSSGAATQVIFDGNGPQSISATTFNNLTFNKAVGSIATLTGDVTIKGNLLGTSGTLDIKSFFFNRDAAGGNATMADAATLIIGADNAPNLFSNYFLAPGSTVIFNGTADQHLLLPGVVYGNIVFRNSGNKILYTPITVNSDLTIEAGATFNGGSNVITLNGNWINNGTFTASSSTVLANGIAKSLSGNTTFNNLTVFGSYTILNNNIFNGLLNVTNTGSLTAGPSIETLINGDIINSGTVNVLGTTTISCDVLQHISLINASSTVLLRLIINGSVSPIINSTSSPKYGYITINNTAGITSTTGVTVLYSLVVGPGGIFHGGNSTHNILGSVTNNGTITSSGTFNFNPASAATINLGNNFTSTGEVIFGGTGAMTLAGPPISFNDVSISNTNAIGITPSSNWVIKNNLGITAGSVLHASNYNYFIGGNILNNGTINAQTSNFILNGTNTQELNTLSALNNVTVNKAGGFCTLANNLTITGELNFTKGIIRSGNFKVIQPSNGTVTGAAQNTGWVAGHFQKAVATATTTKNFEIGDNNVYTPTSLLFTAVSTAGNLTASSIAGEHPDVATSDINPSKSLNRYYTLTNNGIAFSEASGTFNFVASDVDAGADTANFKASIYNGSSWVLPNTLAPNPTNIQVTNLTNFGDFAFGEICNYGTTISYPGSPYCTNAGTAVVTLKGTSGGVFSAGPGISINAATGAINLGASTPGTYNITYTISANANCKQFITQTNITIAIPGTWTGAIDSNWNNPGNWSCNGIPNATTDVTIPSSVPNPSILENSINEVKGLTLNPGTSLSIAYKAAFTINGAYTNDAGTIINNGLLVMAGSEAGQGFPGVNGFVSAMNKLELKNSSGISLNKSFEINGVLIPTAGNINVADGVIITLKSNADSTASVSEIKSGASISYTDKGKFEVERFIRIPNKWQMVSVPVNDTTQTIKSAWAEGQDAGQNNVPGYGTNISGPGGAPNLDFASPGYSLKYWDNIIQNWQYVIKKDTTIAKASGYFLYVRGDRSVVAGGPYGTTTLRTRGKLFINPTIPVTPNKYNSLGNPLASEIDLRKLVLTNSNITTGTKFYMWDPALPGSYSVGGYQTLTYNGFDFEITPGGGGNSIYPVSGSVVNIIESGQAIYMVDSTATAVTFPEISKVEVTTSSRGLAARTEPVNWQRMRITLFAKAGAQNILADGVAVDIADQFDNAINKDDAEKFTNSGENLSLYRNLKKLTVERHFTLTNKDTFQLRIEKVLQKNYLFKIDFSGMEYINLQPFMVDRMLQTETPLNSLQANEYNFTVNANAASYAVDRFYIIFKTLSVVPVKFISVNAARTASGKVNVDWKIDNEVNMQQYQVERSENGTNFSHIGSLPATNNSRYLKIDEQPSAGINYYRIKAIAADGAITYSIIVKVLPVDKISNVNIYPNPVTDNKVNVQFENMAAGKYNLQLMQTDGKLIHQEIVAVPSAIFKYTLNLSSKIAGGYYLLRVVKDDKSIMEISVIVK